MSDYNWGYREAQKMMGFAKGGKVTVKAHTRNPKAPPPATPAARDNPRPAYKCGGSVKKYAKGGAVKHDDAKQDAKQIKSMVKTDCMKKAEGGKVDDRAEARRQIDEMAKKNPGMTGGPPDDPTNFRAREKVQENINVIRRRMQDKYPDEDWYGEHGKKVIRGKPVEKAKGGSVKKMAKGGKWIAGAIKHPGALHKQLKVPMGKKIPAKKLAAAAKKGGTLGRRARLAETLKSFKK